jgi:cyclopropane-fatty-acyl-phospholipid synthase
LWSLLEYVLHRFVLHGIRPFSSWHGEHHARPGALISSPLLLSLSLFAALAATPAWWLLGVWPGMAITLGLMAGYLAYGLTHHAVHHRMPAWVARNAWMGRRRTRHAMHHYTHHATTVGRPGTACHYGVSNSVWDAVFGTNPQIKTP